MPMTLPYRMAQLARTAAEWAADDQTLYDGELAFEDQGDGTYKIKIGTGAKYSETDFNILLVTETAAHAASHAAAGSDPVTLTQAQVTGLVSALAGKLDAANNLSDVADPATARGNIGAGTGDMLGANNLSDVADPATARSNIGAVGFGSLIDINDASYNQVAATATTLFTKSARSSNILNIENACSYSASTIDNTIQVLLDDAVLSSGYHYYSGQITVHNTYRCVIYFEGLWNGPSTNNWINIHVVGQSPFATIQSGYNASGQPVLLLGDSDNNLAYPSSITLDKINIKYSNSTYFNAQKVKTPPQTITKITSTTGYVLSAANVKPAALLATYLDATYATRVWKGSVQHQYTVQYPIADTTDNDTTGTGIVKLPPTTGDVFHVLEIAGFDYSTGGWKVLVAGFTYHANVYWISGTANVSGRPPFDSIRLGSDGAGSPVIMLGDLTTVWDERNFQVNYHYRNASSSSDGNIAENHDYAASVITDETGYVVRSTIDPIYHTAPNYWLADDAKALFGTGKDHAIHSDGVDLHIDTQAVGTGDLKIDGGDVDAVDGAYQVAGTQVVGAQGAAVADASSADATDLASAITLVNELKTQLNTLLARMRAHGLIAT